MAGIDKTYTNSYEEYKEFLEWSKDKEIEFFDGFKMSLVDCIYDYWEEEDFNDGERPVMNTPAYVDVYLIQNCPFKFVTDRMKEVYSKETYEELKSIDLKSKPSDDFQTNRKVVVCKNEYSKFPIHNKPYAIKGHNVSWWLQSFDADYNEETKKWVTKEIYYPTDTNTVYFKSIKAIIRHLRKQYLPKDIEFEVVGGFVGERYTIKIK